MWSMYQWFFCFPFGCSISNKKIDVNVKDISWKDIDLPDVVGKVNPAIVSSDKKESEDGVKKDSSLEKYKYENNWRNTLVDDIENIDDIA